MSNKCLNCTDEVVRDDKTMKRLHWPMWRRRRPLHTAVAGHADAAARDATDVGTSAALAGEGHVDTLHDGVVGGWAWFPACPERAALIEVRAGDVVIGRATANRNREDLREAGKRDGACAFSIALEGHWTPGQRLTVRACMDAQCVDLHAGELELGADDCAAAATRTQRPLDVMPVALTAVPGVCGFLDHVDLDGSIKGWATRDDDPGAAVSLTFVEHDVALFTVEAADWRPDLAELRQGDGCCGFNVEVPDSLRDGCAHALDIRLADTDQSLLSRPVWVRPAVVRGVPTAVAARPQCPAPLRREPAHTPLTLSVVVVFYNMQREAERTLTSLSAAYQHDVDGLDYEVLCVDNGSDAPLDEDWVRSFGPQFRLLRPTRASSSPCAAINEAALEARGRYLAIMIDGAHVLTPGIFHEAMAVFATEPEAVVGVRHWFVGGDQRWLSAAGYSRAMEDRLFQRIRWPADGYRLFRVGAAITESPDPWFDWLNESNCLFLPTSLFDAIGGMDEAFSEPGGGFANLDLARRAEDAAADGLTCLIGEATFHQYHQGTTTNVCDEAKDAQVRAYAARYRRLRGREFEGIDRNRLKFRGSMRNDDAIAVRQRPLLPMTLGVTDTVRPGSMHVHFDEGSQTYLQSVYAECGLQRHTRWLGRDVALAPADLINLQEIIGQQRPTRIVTTSGDPGLIGFLDSILALHGLHEALIIQVLRQPSEPTVAARVRRVTGAACAAATLQTIQRLLGTEESTLVLFQPDSDDALPIDAIAAYAGFVSYRSYLVFLGTVFGQPWLGYSSRWYRTAIRRFVARHPDFVVEHSWDRQLLTSCPSGYVRRVGGRVTLDTYDASLNQLESV